MKLGNLGLDHKCDEKRKLLFSWDGHCCLIVLATQVSGSNTVGASYKSIVNLEPI